MNERSSSDGFSPEPETNIGHFVIERKLGEGGMGVVYLAQDPALRRPVALKLLRPDRAQRTVEAQRRMLREAQAMARVSHPNLVVVYEVGTHADGIYLAMEYIVGLTLTEWLDEERSPEEILNVFEQAGQALQAVHQAGVVHRDFKPDNVMVTQNGEAKLLDLGIAHMMDDARQTSEPSSEPSSTREAAGASMLEEESGDRLTRSGVLVGTPAYMAPEQFGGADASPKADQFAFGVALFEALTGKRPYGASTPIVFFTRLAAGVPLRWPAEKQIPERLQLAVTRMLIEAPDERFEDMDAAVRACRDALGLRGQLKFRVHHWLRRGRDPEYLLPDGELLVEARHLLKTRLSSLDDMQVDYLRTSLATARRARLRRRTVIAGLGALVAGLVPTTYLLQRRTHELEEATRRQVQAGIEHVQHDVERAFERAEARIRLIFAQRRVWFPSVLALLEESSYDPTDRSARLLATLTQLNDYFRPIVEQTASISSLHVATANMAYMLFDDPDAHGFDPSYRFYNRVVQPDVFDDAAFEVFWPLERGTARTHWLQPGQPNTRGRSWSGYRPSERSWFRRIISAPEHQTSWTEPYLFFTTKDPGITAGLAWNSQGKSFVLAVDHMLTDVSQVTGGLHAGMLGLIVTEAGHVVALPRDTRFGTTNDVRDFYVQASRRSHGDQALLPTVADLEIPILVSAMQEQPTGSGVFSFAHEGQSYWAGSAPVGRPEQRLRVLIVADGTATD